MIECPIYFVNPNTTVAVPSPPSNEIKECGPCNCGYLQFENLLSYLKEINDKLNEDQETFNELEFKLREQIIEVSRLFDITAGVRSGYFSKAHCSSTKVYTTNDTKYLRVDDFVPGSLVVRTLDDYIVDENSYRYENNHLVFLPCEEHQSCGCSNGSCGCSRGCSNVRVTRPRPWPHKCYKLTAKWGRECADFAVQMAIRDYLIESYRMSDPVKVLANGLPIQTKFSVPYSWSTYITNFKQKKNFFGQFALA